MHVNIAKKYLTIVNSCMMFSVITRQYFNVDSTVIFGQCTINILIYFVMPLNVNENIHIFKIPSVLCLFNVHNVFIVMGYTMILF